MSNDTFEIEALDQPTFTQVGHWVAFRSDLSPTARHLYTVLATFVNQGRRANGDTDVWPSLNLLAVTLGLSKGKSVTPYMDELIQARIVEKTTNTIGGMRSRNTYGIRFNPPPGEKTATSFVKLLEPLKALAGDAKAMNKVAMETRELIKERRARESAKRTGRPVVPDRGLRRPASGTTYPRIGDRNKTQGELDVGRTTPLPPQGSGHAEREPAPVAEKTTKRTPEQIIIDKLTSAEAQPQGGPPTPEEATAVKRRVIAQAAADGVRIRSTEGYLSGRDVALLEQDLAAVRGLQPPAAARTGDYWENQMRSERNARNGVRGGSRMPIPDHNFWKNVPDDQEYLRNMLFGPPSTTKPPHDPRYAPGTGSWVDPNAQYTTDPKVVFGTSDADEFSGDF